MGRSVYATIEDLRAAGLSDETLHPDEALIDLLELSSVLVESVTGQHFGPVRKKIQANGLGRRIVEEENRNKIIEVISVEVLRFGILREFGFLSNSPFILNGNDYALHERFIRIRPVDESSSPFYRAFRDLNEARFPNDDRNVEITAVFGWLDLGDKLETTLAQDLAQGATSIRLNNTGDIEKNDLLLVDGRFWVIAHEITTPSVETPATEGVVRIDPSPKKAASGAAVVRYGKVPRLVRQAVIRTAIANQTPPGSEEEQQALALRRVRREETDNYEIEFFAAPGSDKVNTGTGDPIADAYLSGFRRPSVTARWV